MWFFVNTFYYISVIDSTKYYINQVNIYIYINIINKINAFLKIFRELFQSWKIIVKLIRFIIHMHECYDIKQMKITILQLKSKSSMKNEFM